MIDPRVCAALVDALDSLSRSFSLSQNLSNKYGITLSGRLFSVPVSDGTVIKFYFDTDGDTTNLFYKKE